MNGVAIHLRLAGARAFLVLTVGVLILGCFASVAVAQTKKDQGKTTSAVTVDTRPVDDGLIARRLREIFRNVDGLGSVAVDVGAGVVRLSGVVESEKARANAVGLARRVEGVVDVRAEIEVRSSVGVQASRLVDRLRERLRDLLVYLPLILLSLLTFAFFWLLARWAARRHALFSRISDNPFLRQIGAQSVRVVIVVLGLVIALEILDATSLIGAVLGAAGLTGLVIGFALKETVENYVAGILLSLRQPFAPHDHIQIEGREGHVVRLTSRATVLMTLDGNHVWIPNATVFKGIIENYSRNPERRFDFEVGVGVDADLAQARRLAVRTLEELPSVLEDPPPEAWIEAFGDSSMQLHVHGWMDQRHYSFPKVRGEAIRRVKHAFEEAGYDLPEPIFRVNLTKPEAPAANDVRPPPAVTGVAAEGFAETDLSRDTHLHKEIAEERALMGDQDLLQAGAPRE